MPQVISLTQKAGIPLLWKLQNIASKIISDVASGKEWRKRFNVLRSSFILKVSSVQIDY